MLHRIGSDLRGPLLNVDSCLMSVNIEFLTECFVTYIAGVSIGFCWLFCIHYFSLFIFSFKTDFFFFIFSPWMLTMCLEKRISFLNINLHIIQVKSCFSGESGSLNPVWDCSMWYSNPLFNKKKLTGRVHTQMLHFQLTGFLFGFHRTFLPAHWVSCWCMKKIYVSF